MPDTGMKFVIDVVNSEKMIELTAEMGKQKLAVIALNEQLKQNVITQQQFAAASAPIGQRMSLINQQMKELQASSGGAGRGLGQLAYAVDDLQYGFNAIVNNIPQIIMGLGGGVGIAGVVGILAVAINQLIKHWDELTDHFGLNFSSYAVERLQEIKQKAEDAAKSFDQLKNSLNEFETKGAAGAKKAIVDARAAELEKMIGGALLGEVPLPPETARTIGAHGEALPFDKDVDMRRRQAAQQAEAEKRARELIGGLALGDLGARGRIKGLMDSGRFNPDAEFRKQFAESDPDAIRAKEEADKKSKEKAKEWDETRKAEELMKKDQEERAKGIRKEIEERIKGEKAARIAALEEQRAAVMDKKHKLAEDLWEGTRHHQTSQILQGARAGIDLYQTGSAGARDKELREKEHRLQEEANKVLKSIDENIKKERRLVLTQ